MTWGFFRSITIWLNIWPIPTNHPMNFPWLAPDLACWSRTWSSVLPPTPGEGAQGAGMPCSGEVSGMPFFDGKAMEILCGFLRKGVFLHRGWWIASMKKSSENMDEQGWPLWRNGNDPWDRFASARTLAMDGDAITSLWTMIVPWQSAVDGGFQLGGTPWSLDGFC